MLAADPTVRGLMDALSRRVEGGQADPARFDELAPPLQRLAEAFEGIVAGQSPAFSWRALITGRPPDRRELRRFILVQPQLDYSALQPGEAASTAIRHAAHELGLDADGEVGSALALAAASIAAGFYAFLPTQYRGVSDLGLIAGTGMIVAFVASVTLLPALIALARPPGERSAVGYAGLGPLDRFLLRHRRAALAVAGIVAAGSLVLLPWLQFDFNPLHLRSAKVESVATLLDLTKDPSTTPNSVDLLAPSVAEAGAMTQRLEQLPEVDHAITLASFVPERQAEKLALIEDAAMLLDPVLNPAQVKTPPNDEDIVRAMERTARSLELAAAVHPGTALAAASARLAKALWTLARGEPASRERVRAELIPGFIATLGQLRAALQAGPVTLATLPDDLKRDWVAA